MKFRLVAYVLMFPLLGLGIFGLIAIIQQPHGSSKSTVSILECIAGGLGVTILAFLLIMSPVDETKDERGELVWKQVSSDDIDV